MLKTLPTRQNPGEPRRQWISDDYFDLYVWYGPDDTVVGFQLCYDKTDDERALTWMSTGAFRHERIDPGDNSPFHSRSPAIAQGCPFAAEPIRSEFLKRSVALETKLRDLILQKLDAFVDQ